MRPAFWTQLFWQTFVDAQCTHELRGTVNLYISRCTAKLVLPKLICLFSIDLIMLCSHYDCMIIFLSPDFSFLICKLQIKLFGGRAFEVACQINSKLKVIFFWTFLPKCLTGCRKSQLQFK